MIWPTEHFLNFHVILPEARRYHKWSKVEVTGNWRNCYRWWELTHLWFPTKLLSLIFLVLFNLLCIYITAGLGNTSIDIIYLSIIQGWTAHSLHKAVAGFTKMKGTKSRLLWQTPLSVCSHGSQSSWAYIVCREEVKHVLGLLLPCQPFSISLSRLAAG